MNLERRVINYLPPVGELRKLRFTDAEILALLVYDQKEIESIVAARRLEIADGGHQTTGLGTRKERKLERKAQLKVAEIEKEQKKKKSR